MTKEEFIKIGKSKGIPKNELLRKFKALDAAGKFEAKEEPKTEESFGQKADKAGMAFGQSLAHSATLGLKDHLNAMVNTAIQEGKELFTGKDKQTIGDRYSSNLKRERDFRESLKEEAPVASAVGDISGYMTPGGIPSMIGKGTARAVGKTALAKSTKLLPRLAGKAIETGVGSGITEGLKTGIETGDVREAGKTAVSTGLTGLGVGAGGSVSSGIPKKVTKGMKSFGEKNISALLRPGRSKKTKAFKIENVFKHKVDDATLEGMSEKTAAKLDGLRDDLNNLVTENNQFVDVNIQQVFEDVLKDFGKDKIKNVGKNENIKNAVVDLAKELTGVIKDKKISVLDAMDIKRSVGRQAKFVYGEPATVARSEVYQKFYHKLNSELEKKLPQEFKKINKDFTELIPIKNVIENRLPIANSNFGISPLTLISAGMGAGAGAAHGGDTESAIKGALIGGGLKYAATSPRVAKGVYRTSEKLSKVPALPETIKTGAKMYGSKEISERNQKRITIDDLKQFNSKTGF